MARTAAGAALTVQHRRGQLQIRARALQDYVRLWPLWQGDSASFGRLVAASVPLVRVHHRLSSSLGASYFEAFRRAEGVTGSSAARLAKPLDVDRFTAGMVVTGAAMTRKAITAGQSPQAAMRTALVRTSGTIGRFVLDGGRETTTRSIRVDPKAEGQSRITNDGACAFCTELAAGGPIYGDLQAHDHCACTGEAAYPT